MARQNTVEIVINADDRASKKVSGIKGALGGLKSALGGIGKIAGTAFLGLAGAATAAGAGILKLASDAAAIEPIERDFGRLSKSIGETTETMIKGMREASYGMVRDADLMQSANRLISMGLAESAEEASEMTRMAVRLGEAMGKGPTEAMEEFALMMANQSIPRLDTFGISAGKVRERMAELMGEASKGGLTQGQLSGAIGKSNSRIEELQKQLHLATLRQSEYTDKTRESTKVAGQMRIDKLNQQLAEEQAKLGKLRNTTASLTTATKKLSREEAFAQAVRELGAESLERVGEGGVGAAASMARLQASFANIKDQIGKAFIPILATLLEPLSDLAQKYGPLVIDWARQFAAWLEFKVIPAVMDFGKRFVSVVTDLVRYIQVVLGEGDTLNDWLTHLPGPLQAIAKAAGEVISALSSLGQYIAGVLVDGDTLNDWLTHLPEPMQGVVKSAADAGVAIVEWVREAIPTVQEYALKVEDFLNGANRAVQDAGTATREWILGAWDDVQQYWNETLKPALMDVQTWFQVNIPLAMGAISRFWTNRLQPTLLEIGTHITGPFSELLVSLAGLFRAVVEKGMAWIVYTWNTTGEITFTRIGEIINEQIIPPVEDIIEFFGDIVALIKEKVAPTLDDFRENSLDVVADGFDAIRTAIEKAIEYVDSIAKKIRNLPPVPPWYRGESPPPIAQAFSDIADAVNAATVAVSRFDLPAPSNLSPNMVGAGGIGGQRTIVIAPVMLDPRQYQNARGDYDYQSIGEWLMSLEKGL